MTNKGKGRMATKAEVMARLRAAYAEVHEDDPAEGYGYNLEYEVDWERGVECAMVLARLFPDLDAGRVYLKKGAKHPRVITGWLTIYFEAFSDEAAYALACEYFYASRECLIDDDDIDAIDWMHFTLQRGI